MAKKFYDGVFRNNDISLWRNTNVDDEDMAMYVYIDGIASNYGQHYHSEISLRLNTVEAGNLGKKLIEISKEMMKEHESRIDEEVTKRNA